MFQSVSVENYDLNPRPMSSHRPSSGTKCLSAGHDGSQETPPRDTKAGCAPSVSSLSLFPPHPGPGGPWFSLVQVLSVLHWTSELKPLGRRFDSWSNLRSYAQGF